MLCEYNLSAMVRSRNLRRQRSPSLPLPPPRDGGVRGWCRARPVYGHVTAHDTESIVETEPSLYPRHCLYVRDLMICRSGVSDNRDGVVLADSALTVNSTLADTGAGPSVVTTALIAV